MKQTRCNCTCADTCPQGKVGSQERCLINVKETYWERLKDHPGVGVANIMCILGFLAGAGNKSAVWWQGGLLGLSIGVICWIIVLCNNGKR